MNCVANGRLARESGFDNVWIQPAAGDDGIAIGCAYYGHLALQNKQRSYVLNSAYFGKAYAEEEVKDVVNRRLIRLVTKQKSSTNICADTAKKLAAGHVVGWFQGRSDLVLERWEIAASWPTRVARR